MKQARQQSVQRMSPPDHIESVGTLSLPAA